MPLNHNFDTNGLCSVYSRNGVWIFNYIIWLCTLLTSLLWCYIGKEKPNIKDLHNYVVPKWASKWRQLGTQLNIDQHLMDNIGHDHPSDCENCCCEMFTEWLDSNPAASWNDIITAVDNLSHEGSYAIASYIVPHSRDHLFLYKKFPSLIINKGTCSY